HVRLGTGGAAGVVFGTGAPAHQVGGFHFDVRFGYRELHALVLANGAAKHFTLAGVTAGLVDKPAAITDTLGGNQGALGIEAGKNIAKPLAFLADQAVGRDFQVVEEQLVGDVVHHVFDRLHGHAVA